MVIVILAAIAPVLAHMLASASAAHHDAARQRALVSSSHDAIDAAGVRLRAALADPGVAIASANDTSITLSDGTALWFENGAVRTIADGLPGAALVDGVARLTLEYADAAGGRLDPSSPGFDQSAVARIGLIAETDDGIKVTDRVYREGTRPFRSTGGVLEWGTALVGPGWTTVELSNRYEDMVVVCTVERTNNTAPTVVRVRDAADGSFDVRLQNPGALDTLTADRVHYIVAERGVYDTGSVRFEADRVASPRTNHKRDWTLPPLRAYGQAYTAPVVVGQVMTTNDDRFSVFWCAGDRLSAPPDADALRIGLHAGEDTDRTRLTEQIAYFVFETGTGTVGGIEFQTALGPDVVTHVPSTRPFARAFLGGGETVVIAAMNAIDGQDGGFVVMLAPPSDSHAQVLIDEDQIGDNDRYHTTEQVAIVAFDEPGSWDGR